MTRNPMEIAVKAAYSLSSICYANPGPAWAPPGDRHVCVCVGLNAYMNACMYEYCAGSYSRFSPRYESPNIKVIFTYVDIVDVKRAYRI